MEKFKGTPGPWSRHAELNNEHNDNIGSVISSDGWIVCEICNIKKEEDEANAQLIASAPELLEALQEIVGHFAGFTPLEIEAKEKAQSAINKALGINQQNK